MKLTIKLHYGEELIITDITSFEVEALHDNHIMIVYFNVNGFGGIKKCVSFKVEEENHVRQ